MKLSPEKLSAEPFNPILARPANYALSRDTFFLVGFLLPLADILTLLLCGYLSMALSAVTLGSAGAWAAVLVAALLAPFILYDKQFGVSASRGQRAALVRAHAVRFALLAGVVLIMALLNQSLASLPAAWLGLWGATSLLLTSLTRVLLATNVRRLEQRGVLREVIAVVGCGPLADRLVRQLRQGEPNIELLGVFDDKIASQGGALTRTGSVAELIELGKTRKIDWIVMTLPCTAEDRLRAIVHRLKALAVPIGLCPPNVGLTLPCDQIDYLGDGVPITLLSDRPIRRWGAVIKGGEDFVPRWMITWLLLPFLAIQAFRNRVANSVPTSAKPLSPRASLTYQFDNYDLAGFMAVARGFGQNRFGYVVTPNADHLIRLHEDAPFRAHYAGAAYVLLDSNFLSNLLRITKGIRLPVCTGSDLTATLLKEVVEPDDALVLIGGSSEQAQQITQRFGLKRLAHFNPPMGFIHDPQAVEACLRFVEAHSPFRFCLLAVGTPQQEMLAQLLKERGIARGLTFCTGAAINFLTGVERRAPLWLRRAGLEWLFRLVRSPGRLGTRYLVRGPRVFGLLRRAQIVLRPAPALTLVGRPTTPAKVAAQPVVQAEPVGLRPLTPALAEVSVARTELRDNRSVSAPI